MCGPRYKILNARNICDWTKYEPYIIAHKKNKYVGKRDEERQGREGDTVGEIGNHVGKKDEERRLDERSW